VLRPLSLVFFISSLFFPFAVQAQTTSLFETHANLGFFDLENFMECRLDGKLVENYADFKKIIYSLRDPEASHLIREAEETDFASWVLLGAGLAGAADVALVYSPVVVFHNDWADRLATFVVTAQIGLGAWTIVHNVAEARKFNAVQRYNHVLLTKAETSSLELQPSLYVSMSSLVLGEKLTF
jgi:hypothetical protein